MPQLQHICGSTPNKPLWVLQEDGNSARKKQAKVGCALCTKVFRVTWLALLRADLPCTVNNTNNACDQ